MPLYSGLTKKAQLWIAFLFVLLFLVVSSYASLLYGQYKVERQITQFRQDNERLVKENRDRWIALVRLSLQRVVEKENKANMNRVRPGERVIVINDDESKNFVLKEQKSDKKSAVEGPRSLSIVSSYGDDPNPRKWWYFFFPPSTLPDRMEIPAPPRIDPSIPQS